jgi:hypothetical protein
LSRNWRSGARRGWPLAAILAAAVLGLSVSLLLRSQPATPAWTGWLNSGLEHYADTAGQWNSGDNAVQVALPGHRALWLFNDSFYGPVHADGTVSRNTPLVRNMLLLTTGEGNGFKVKATITGPVSDGVPSAAVPALPGSAANSWAWPDGGMVVGSSVQAIYTVFAPQGPDPLGYIPVANEVVTMPLASLTQPSTYRIQPANLGQAMATAACGPGGTNCVQWGVGLLNAAACPPPTGLSACTYIYGELWPASGESSRTLVVAVAPRNDLAGTGAWWYDTTSGWSRSPTALAAPLGRGTRFTAGSVYQLPGGEYVVFGSGPVGAMIAYYARDPWLSGARGVRLFSAPDPGGVPEFLAYQFHIDPAYSSGTSVVIGFSVTSFAVDQNCLNYAPYFDVAAYQPEFYSITLPASAGAAIAGGPRTLPARQLRPFLRRSSGEPSWRPGSCENS